MDKLATSVYNGSIGAPFSGAIVMLRVKLGLSAFICALLLCGAPISFTSASVGTAITYQGQLMQSGQPANGSYDFRLFLYDSEAGGSQVGNTVNADSVAVVGGVFKLDPDFGTGVFEGDPRWIEIQVRPAGSGTYNTLSPRRQVTPAPYAIFAARVGMHDHFGETWSGTATGGLQVTNQSANTSSWGVRGNVATGTAVRGYTTGGLAVSGFSENNVGVRGASDQSWGGHFSSDSGNGIRVESSGSRHYDHGAWISSQSGWGVYAQSATNQAVRGEAGNVSGISQPLGAVGVVGIGANRGTYGSSSSGIGVYGVSSSNYGVWGQSANHRGVTGRTSRADNNYGFFSPDNLYALNVTTSGAVMQVVRNNGDVALQPGEVAAFSGFEPPIEAGANGMVTVTRATANRSEAVAGVVYSRFNIDAIRDDEQAVLAAMSDEYFEVTPAGAVAPGEYLLLVVFGPAEVLASGLEGEIQPGDPLTISSLSDTLAMAARADKVGDRIGGRGAVFAKALGSLMGTEDRIYVYVTLQ
jgi:hypothetical protein